MNVIFFGSDVFSQLIVEEVCRSSHNIVAVVTTPDKKKGRGRTISKSMLARWAEEHNIPCYQPSDLEQKAFQDTLWTLEADIFIVASYGKILPTAVITIPKKCCINAHPSLLPKYRGPSPIQCTLLNGDPFIGTTIIRLNEKIDSGDILLQERVPVNISDDYISLRNTLGRISGKLICNALDHIDQNTISYMPQNDDEKSYARLLKKEDGCVHWNNSAKSIHNQIRALCEWPSAYSHYKKKKINIFKSELIEGPRTDIFDTAGIIIEIKKDVGVIVKTGDGYILLREIQSEGKKRMSAVEWANGQRISIGEGFA